MLDAAAVLFLADALATAGAVRAGRALGLFSRLADGPATAEVLAVDLGVDRRRLGALLHALECLGLVVADRDGWWSSPEARAVGRLVDPWDELATAIRSGHTPLAVDTSAGAAAHYPDLVALLTPMIEASARAAVDVLAPARRVLDVGAGAAEWSLALARRDPDCRVTALDLPEVVPSTRRAVTQAGVADRYTYLAGDAFAVDLPDAAFDLVVVANVCHLFGADANRRLLGRLRPALAAGGRLAVIDRMEEDGSPPDRSAALHQLSLALRTDAGAQHRAADYVTWLRAAGLRPAGRHRLDPSVGLDLLVAEAA